MRISKGIRIKMKYVRKLRILEAACGICGEDFLANHQQEDEIKNDDDNLKHVGCLNITTKELNGDIK